MYVFEEACGEVEKEAEKMEEGKVCDGPQTSPLVSRKKRDKWGKERRSRIDGGE